MRKEVMSLAWALIKATSNTITNLSTALKAAWKAIKAKFAIATGGAIVQFEKADGSVVARPALPFAGTVKGTGKSNPLTILFHDPKANATKSFRADRLHGFLAVSHYMMPALNQNAPA